MRKLLVVAGLVLALAAMVIPAQANTVLDSLGQASVDIVYARSFDTGEDTSVLKVAFPVVEGQILGKDYTINADALGFFDGADLGAGGSVTFKNLISSLDLGVGYLPRGYGWSGYIGLKKISF